MRLHTNAPITAQEVRDIASALPGVHADVIARRSRSHVRAFDVKLTGTSTRRPNNGRGGRFRDDLDGGPYDYATTWDEWGMLLAALYQRDSNMVAGTVKHPTYQDADHFHEVTGDRFRTLKPADQHRSHRWEYDSPRVFTCKCGAVQDQSGSYL